MFYRKTPKEVRKEKEKELTESEIRYGISPACFEVYEKWSEKMNIKYFRNVGKYQNANKILLHFCGHTFRFIFVQLPLLLM